MYLVERNADLVGANLIFPVKGFRYDGRDVFIRAPFSLRECTVEWFRVIRSSLDGYLGNIYVQ
jgi:hypothetical protein